MVSRKTRLMSALLAILMVVSMLTAFVLPAVAETTYPLYRDHEKEENADVTEWAIAGEEDWIAAVAASEGGENFSGEVLHFTNVSPLPKRWGLCATITPWLLFRVRSRAMAT